MRWRSIYASYLAGVGVNAIIPARAGDAVRLYLAHRAVPATTYITLGATLLVLSIFDTAMALMIFAYALTLGVLPGIGSLGSLPGFDFGFFVSNPEFSAVLLIVLVIFGTIGFFWARIHIDEFKARVGQGLRGPPRPHRIPPARRGVAGRRLVSTLPRDLVLPRRVRDPPVDPERAPRAGDAEPGDARPDLPRRHRHRAGVHRLRLQGVGIDREAALVLGRHEADA